MQFNCSPRLGAIQVPSNCDAVLVTSTRIRPDGTPAAYIGDYELTQSDLQAIESWRQACIVERQRATDAAAAAAAANAVSQGVSVSPFTTGPGAQPTTNVHYAVQLAQQIQDPNIKQQTLNQIQSSVNKHEPEANIKIPGATNGSSSSGNFAPPGSYVIADPGPNMVNTAVPSSGAANWMPAVIAVLALALT